MSLPRPEYPRPTLVRDRWLNLNGEWRFRMDADEVGLGERWFAADLPDAATISVPYPVESRASGIQDTQPAAVVWYQRDVEVPADWQGRVALRVGACDHWSRVFVNDLEVGQHRGGYAPFAFDVQHALQPGINRITIRAADSPSWTQPRGKQAGTTRWPIDYDGVTGIWQTVWLEPLPAVSIETTAFEFSHASGQLTYVVGFSAQVDGDIRVELSRDGAPVATASAPTDGRGETRLQFDMADGARWSPEAPNLYDVCITLADHASGDSDQVTSYLGLRELAVVDGELRLNGAKLYLRGVLDQGYFPDGWYTAPTDADLRRDVELTLALGMNCARKHQKAEDPRYLYWADRLGLLVWSEMPSGRIFSTELVETLTGEWIDLVKRDRAHPSVVAWVPFNESWGVWHQSQRPEQRAFVDAIVALTRALDGSRLVVGNDGWEFSSGDLWTLHLYDDGRDLASRLAELIDSPEASVTDTQNARPRAGALPGAEVGGLPILLTECGGVGFGRYGEEDFSYGERPQTADALLAQIHEIAAEIHAADRLQGFVWTQLTDIQQEINGLLYFDRRAKLPLETLAEVFSGIGRAER
ncbi:MAG: sugar-binding domain-containing protein [Pseudomonadota bacterium]